MKTTILNLRNSKIPYLSDSQLMRVDFILSKILISATEMGNFLIQYEQAFEEDKSLEFKVGVIKTHESMFEVDLSGTMSTTLVLYNRINRQKHKKGSDIIMLKKLDKEISNLYKIVGEMMQKNHEKFGFIQLRPLADIGKIGSLRTNTSQHEGNSTNTEYINVSDVIKFIIDKWEPEWEEKTRENVIKNYGETLVTLSTEFFNFNDWNAPEPTSINDNSSSSNFTLDLLLEVPSLITLSAAELELIKEEINETLEPFNQALDTWIALTNKQDPEANNYFINNVLPLKENLQNTLKTNQTLEHLSNILVFKTPVKIYFGTIPLFLLLQYYTYQNIITQPTIDLMENYMNENSINNNLVPFMAIHFNEIEHFEKVDEATTNVFPTKKSIAID